MYNLKGFIVHLVNFIYREVHLKAGIILHIIKLINIGICLMINMSCK